MKKNNKCVLALVMFYETSHKNATKYLRILISVIYTNIDNCVCIDDFACQ